MTVKTQEPFIAQTFINSFFYLAKDAEFFRQLASTASGFDRVVFCRTAVLLYALSLEALINRCMDDFLPHGQRDFFLAREKKLSPMDKFELVPLFVTGKTFVKSDVVWAKLHELFQLRNDFVHPKHDRVAFLKVLANNEMEPLDLNYDLPAELQIKPKDLRYPNLQIPTDPYSILPEHLERVKEASEDVLQKLNEFLEGRVLKDSWHIRDQMELVYPKGKTWKDVLNWSETLPRHGWG